MTELFSRLDGSEIVGLVAIVLGTIGGTSVVLSAIIMPLRSAARKAEIDAQLKSELIAKNYSAADIERILKAGTDAEGKTAAG